ncbi:cytosolic protein [Hyaloraphidium curvatum]|nr:cytosolic protein [Hyaloraphidium curvatum]
MSVQAIRDLARRFIDSIERGDPDAVLRCYAPAAGIWHNTDLIVQTPTENLSTLKGLIAGTAKREYRDRKVRVFDGPDGAKGFVHQHVLVATTHGGRKMELPAVLVCEVSKDGATITRLEEYYDQRVVDEWTRPAKERKPKEKL